MVVWDVFVVDVEVDDEDEVDDDEDAVEVELSDIDNVERGRVTFCDVVVVFAEVVLGVVRFAEVVLGMLVLEVVSLSGSSFL